MPLDIVVFQLGLEPSSNFSINMSDPRQDIDENYFSRQLYVLGHEAMRRVRAARVLLSGMSGLGLEVAKNAVLAGVGEVTLHDAEPLARRDLSSQFYGREEDLNRNRAELSHRHLEELNEFVRVSHHSRSLTEDFLSEFQVVVLTNSSLREQLDMGIVCRARGIKLIVASTRGLFGQIFCDFGDEFIVLDPTGNTITSTVASISKGNPGVVTCAETKGHRFENGDLVAFTGVRGMTELNHCQPRTVAVIGEKTFSIGDTSDLSDYTEGGEAIKINVLQPIKFLPLQEALVKPRFKEECDHSVHFTLHKAFQALHRFHEKHGRLPRPHNQADADELVEACAGVEVEPGATPRVELREELVRLLAFTAQGDLAPLNSFIGGVAAQEVIKACTGSFVPLNQWMYHSAASCLPKGGVGTPGMEEDCKPLDSRYDGQIAVFGKKFQDKIASLKYFLVGAGAIGCELLKNFAMMGLGEVAVTDMDTIERSNLHRQFLFRPGNVKEWKSEVAALAAREMNPDVRVTPFRLGVGPASESDFSDGFFDRLDGVATALDNDEARRYVDRRCVNQRTPMLDGGTEGLRGSVQVAVPLLTRSYGCVASPRSTTIPVCSVRSNPSTIAHTLQWAKEQFETLFAVEVTSARERVENAEDLAERIQSLSLERPSGSDGCHHHAVLKACVAWARRHWQQCYHHPASRSPTTSSNVRSPKCLEFSNANALHVDYVAAAVILYARAYGVAVPTDRASVERVLQQDGSALEARSADLLMTHEFLRRLTIQPLVFDKDDDDHMDFIVAASNLRAETFGISPADKHKSKKIVGDIIPAIATSTAAVAGLLCLQLYSLAQGHSSKSDLHDAYVDLGTCEFSMVNPAGPAPHQYLDTEWDVWHPIVVDGREDMTLRQFLDHMTGYSYIGAHTAVEEKHGLVVTDLLCSERLLYPQSEDDDLSKRLTQLLPSSEQPRLGYLELTVVCHGIDSEQDLDVPPIKYILGSSNSQGRQ